MSVPMQKRPFQQGQVLKFPFAKATLPTGTSCLILTLEGKATVFQTVTSFFTKGVFPLFLPISTKRPSKQQTCRACPAGSPRTSSPCGELRA